MKIGLIGTGRLGICLALLIENSGYQVLASDIRDDYVSNLNNKVINTPEPLVQEYLSKSTNFEATTDNIRVIRECDVIFTLVATPSLYSGDYDVSSVWKVIEDFKTSSNEFSVNGKTLVVGCTTNPGDCKKFQKELEPYGVNVIYNPEFIAQGSIIKDLINADMVLIGGTNQKSIQKIEEIYVQIQSGRCNINVMSTTAAEIVKLAVNCYLTTKISYANMVGEVLTLSGLESEIDEVLTAIGEDTRVGTKYLKYGYGFGGPCLPRDNRSFGAYAEKLGLEYNLGTVTDNFNRTHSQFIKNYFIEKNVDKLPFYFSYISYKKGTDILTESQQYKLCTDLLDAGFEVYIDDCQIVIEQVEDFLKSKYGDKVKFGKPTEKHFAINL